MLGELGPRGWSQGTRARATQHAVKVPRPDVVVKALRLAVVPVGVVTHVRALRRPQAIPQAIKMLYLHDFLRGSKRGFSNLQFLAIYTNL